jgi:hypothetical protein
MSEERFSICDVCKKKVQQDERRSPHDPWLHAAIYGYYCGPHSVLGFANNYESAGSTVDLCSGECALKWLEAHIEKIKKSMIEHAATQQRKAEDDRRRIEEEMSKRVRVGDRRP